MNERAIRVLVVDDSAFARKVVREVLSAKAGIEVVGIARDGLDALERVAELRPDVVTLDLVMPHLDGLGVMNALPAEGAPRVVVVSSSAADTALGVAALQAGAFAVVRKPTSQATDRLYELGDALVAAVRAAALARAPAPPSVAPAAPSARVARAHPHRLVVVGTSTGGPQALTRLLAAMPGDFPAPIAVVLHIPVGYTEALAARLDAHCALAVAEASEGLELRPGLAVIARAGVHLKLERRGDQCLARLDMKPFDTPHRPSVNALFESAARGWGADVLGVVLTGMGDDGLEGARAIHAAGGLTLTEAESSCVVYGMPRSVREAGLSAQEVPLDRMAAEIVRRA